MRTLLSQCEPDIRADEIGANMRRTRLRNSREAVESDPATDFATRISALIADAQCKKAAVGLDGYLEKVTGTASARVPRGFLCWINTSHAFFPVIAPVAELPSVLCCR